MCARYHRPDYLLKNVFVGTFTSYAAWSGLFQVFTNSKPPAFKFKEDAMFNSHWKLIAACLVSSFLGVH